MTDAEPKKALDWERIELDYRAGVLSLRELGSMHGITHGAINKRAKRDGWSRDLSAKIKAKADALVSKAAVSTEVSAEALVTERQTVDGNAQAIANVRLTQRRDISRSQKLTMSLLAELEALTGDPLIIDHLEDLLIKVSGGDADSKVVAKAREALNKATSLPSRAGTLKALTDSLKTLVALERQAWGLGENSAPEPEAPSDSITTDHSEAAYARMRG